MCLTFLLVARCSVCKQFPCSACRFLQPLIATLISTLRAPKSSEGYKAIGGGSPLRRITQEQADALAEALHAKGLPASVYVGMRYWHPYTEEAVQQIKDDGVGKLVILPLYPQFSISTSGSSLRLLEQLFKEIKGLEDLQHTVIPSWSVRLPALLMCTWPHVKNK